MVTENNWYWKIDGRIMPTPTKATFDEYDLDAANTGRPESGVLHRERVRHDVVRHNFAFTDLTAEEAWLLRTALAPTQIDVTVRMFDSTETKTMYAGDRHWEQRYDSAGVVHVSLQVQISEY